MLWQRVASRRRFSQRGGELVHRCKRSRRCSGRSGLPVYYVSALVHIAPPPIYYQPAPREYYRSPPIYYRPAPMYYEMPAPDYYPSRGTAAVGIGMVETMSVGLSAAAVGH